MCHPSFYRAKRKNASISTPELCRHLSCWIQIKRVRMDGIIAFRLHQFYSFKWIQFSGRLSPCASIIPLYIESKHLNNLLCKLRCNTNERWKRETLIYIFKERALVALWMKYTCLSAHWFIRVLVFFCLRRNIIIIIIHSLIMKKAVYACAIADKMWFYFIKSNENKVPP